MHYAKSFLAAFVLAVAAFAASPAQGGTADSAIIFIDAQGDIEGVLIGFDAEGNIVLV
jgi:hypothetical protein